MKIVVLAGGRSTERNVSLSSGARIADALRSKGHKVIMVDSFLGININNDNDIEKLFNNNKTQNNDYDISDEILTDEAINSLRHEKIRGLFGKNVLKVAQAADIVYMGLHGEDGENGKVQALLDLNDIKYTGSDTLAAGIAMNKSICKQLLTYNHIDNSKFIEINKDDKIPQHIPFEYPVVVKPNCGGSSVGVSIVNDKNQLNEAIKEAFRFDNKALIEEYIGGREFSVGIVNGVALPAIEIAVSSGWYDFKHKFQPNKETKFITPPDIPDNIHQKMKELAIQAMNVIGLINYCRIDFFLKNNKLYVIEANALPGMTPRSLLPQEAEVAGIKYADLVNSIVTGKMKLYNK